MTSVTATEARKDLYKLIRRALNARDPVRIQHREGGVVVMSEDDYAGLIETLELLPIDGIRESITEAERFPSRKHSVSEPVCSVSRNSKFKIQN